MTATTSKADSPWLKPELAKSPEYVFDTLRETKQMISSLQEREKRLKAEIADMHMNGQLAHLVDDENSNKYNGEGVSVTLMPGKVTRKWNPEVQAQLDKITYEAERKRHYTEEHGSPFWRVVTQKEL